MQQPRWLKFDMLVGSIELFFLPHPVYKRLTLVTGPFFKEMDL